MKYKLYTTSRQAWKGMIASILRAKKYIYIEMYILDNKVQEYNFLDILINKVKAGVEVVLVLDAFGSSDFKSSDIKLLRDNGVEILFFSRWLRRTHRKLLIIDDNIAFLGGVNFHGKSMDWIDLQVKVSNKILIKNILRSFSYSYIMSGGKKKHIIEKRKQSILKNLKAQFLEHFPSRNVYTLEAYYQNKIISANKSIKIVTPYFVPPRWLIALLDNAVSRGVLVEILIPLKTDKKFLDRVNYAHIYQIKNLNIKFYAQKEMNHSKILMIDDQEVLIGSQNLDIMSFRMNVESGMFSSNKKLITDLLLIIQKWKDDSCDFPVKIKNINIFDKIILGFIRLFYSIL